MAVEQPVGAEASVVAAKVAAEVARVEAARVEAALAVVTGVVVREAAA